MSRLRCASRPGSRLRHKGRYSCVSCLRSRLRRYERPPDDASSSKAATFELWPKTKEPSNTTLSSHVLAPGGSSLWLSAQSGNARPNCTVFHLAIRVVAGLCRTPWQTPRSNNTSRPKAISFRGRAPPELSVSSSLRRKGFRLRRRPGFPIHPSACGPQGKHDHQTLSFSEFCLQ